MADIVVFRLVFVSVHSPVDRRQIIGYIPTVEVMGVALGKHKMCHEHDT